MAGILQRWRRNTRNTRLSSARARDHGHVGANKRPGSSRRRPSAPREEEKEEEEGKQEQGGVEERARYAQGETSGARGLGLSASQLESRFMGGDDDGAGYVITAEAGFVDPLAEGFSPCAMHAFWPTSATTSFRGHGSISSVGEREEGGRQPGEKWRPGAPDAGSPSQSSPATSPSAQGVSHLSLSTIADAPTTPHSGAARSDASPGSAAHPPCSTPPATQQAAAPGALIKIHSQAQPCSLPSLTLPHVVLVA
jgi:hypothetical protein